MGSVKTKSSDEHQSLSLKLPLRAEGDSLRKILNSIKEVRSAARQVYAVLFAAQVAGSKIEWNDDQMKVIPDNARAKEILAGMFNKTGKSPVYEVRSYVLEHLLPGYMTFVFDQLRADVWTKWTARDPEFGKASSGYLALNGVRRLAVFANLGIGFPAATARPKFEAHRVILKWSHAIGSVIFRLGDLDPGRWYVWRRIVSGEWKHGTCRLSERDGELFLLVTYERPCQQCDLEPDRVVSVFRSSDGSALLVTGPEREKTHVRLPLTEARDWSLRLAAQMSAWRGRQRAVGNPRFGWGMKTKFRGIQSHIDGITRCRESEQARRNHSWARRIVDLAKSWRCGTVEFCVPEDSQLSDGQPWAWSQFKECLTYKSKGIGAKVVTADANAYRDRQREIVRKRSESQFEADLLCLMAAVGERVNSSGETR